MRMTSSPPSWPASCNACNTHAWNCASSGTPANSPSCWRSTRGLVGFMFFVGVDMARYQALEHHVETVEAGNADLGFILQHIIGVLQAGFHVARQVHLGDVTGDHRLRAEADTRQE